MSVFSQAPNTKKTQPPTPVYLPCPYELIKTSQTCTGIRKLIAIKWEMERPIIHHWRNPFLKINRLKQNNQEWRLSCDGNVKTFSTSQVCYDPALTNNSPPPLFVRPVLTVFCCSVQLNKGSTDIRERKKGI